MPDEPLLLTRITGFLTDDEWPMAWSDDGTARGTYKGENGIWHCFGRVREAEAQFVFDSIAPLTVSGEHRSEVAEFIERANDGTVTGNFEMTWDRGEVRYKTSIDVEGGVLTSTMWRNLATPMSARWTATFRR